MVRDTKTTDLEAAHRAHLRTMTTARQLAEKCLLATRGHSTEHRQAADAVFRAEMARIDAEHREWLSEAGLEEESMPQPKRVQSKGAATL